MAKTKNRPNPSWLHCGGNCPAAGDFGAYSSGARGGQDRRQLIRPKLRAPHVCRRRFVDRAHRSTVARSARSVRRMEQRIPALQPVERQRGLAAHVPGRQ